MSVEITQDSPLKATGLLLMRSCWLDPRMQLGEVGHKRKMQIELLNAY